VKQAGKHPWAIRRATHEDSDLITRFHRNQNRPNRSDSVASEYFIAEVSGDIVGCAATRLTDGLGYFYGLAVDKAWRRRGIGHDLTRCALDWLRNRGAKSTFTLVMFWNIRFFKRHGFELADRRTKQDLNGLHQDFTDKWSVRSVLLVIDFNQTKSSI
jgi:N-acetylglutamate synthase-like GNAT family acetyltransferase